MNRKPPAVLLALALPFLGGGCGASTSPQGPAPAPSAGAAPPVTTLPPVPPVTDDASLFRLFTQADPVSGYVPFPDAEEFATGRLNGSEAHRPLVRVRLNARAAGALVAGRLPAGGRFPDGSLLVKEVRPDAAAAVDVYAVMYRDAASPLAGEGWIWAEFRPDGSVLYPVAGRGRSCTGCHARAQGPENDRVRTFERQR
jgi:hypothetical protein